MGLLYRNINPFTLYKIYPGADWPHYLRSSNIIDRFPSQHCNIDLKLIRSPRRRKHHVLTEPSGEAYDRTRRTHLNTEVQYFIHKNLPQYSVKRWNPGHTPPRLVLFKRPFWYQLHMKLLSGVRPAHPILLDLTIGNNPGWAVQILNLTVQYFSFCHCLCRYRYWWPALMCLIGSYR